MGEKSTGALSPHRAAVPSSSHRAPEVPSRHSQHMACATCTTHTHAQLGWRPVAVPCAPWSVRAGRGARESRSRPGPAREARDKNTVRCFWTNMARKAIPIDTMRFQHVLIRSEHPRSRSHDRHSQTLKYTREIDAPETADCRHPHAASLSFSPRSCACTHTRSVRSTCCSSRHSCSSCRASAAPGYGIHTNGIHTPTSQFS